MNSEKKTSKEESTENGLRFFEGIDCIGRFLAVILCLVVVVIFLQPVGCSVKFGSGGGSCGDGVLEGVLRSRLDGTEKGITKQAE